MSEYIYRSNGEPLANERGEISLALAGEIVRCRDCKHVDEIMTRYAGMQYACMRFDDVTVTPNGFCAWGERREP